MSLIGSWILTVFLGGANVYGGSNVIHNLYGLPDKATCEIVAETTRRNILAVAPGREVRTSCVQIGERNAT